MHIWLGGRVGKCIKVGVDLLGPLQWHHCTALRSSDRQEDNVNTKQKSAFLSCTTKIYELLLNRSNLHFIGIHLYCMHSLCDLLAALLQHTHIYAMRHPSVTLCNALHSGCFPVCCLRWDVPPLHPALNYVYVSLMYSKLNSCENKLELRVSKDLLRIYKLWYLVLFGWCGLWTENMMLRCKRSGGRLLNVHYENTQRLWFNPPPSFNPPPFQSPFVDGGGEQRWSMKCAMVLSAVHSVTLQLIIALHLQFSILRRENKHRFFVSESVSQIHFFSFKINSTKNIYL